MSNNLKNISGLSGAQFPKASFPGLVAVSIFSVALIFFFSGCKKLVEVDAPKTEALTSAVFSTDANAATAMTGMYGSIVNNSSGYFQIGYLGSLSADESDPSTAFYNFKDFGSNTLTSTNGALGSLWSAFYNSIYQANSIIESVEASTGMTDSVKSHYIGEGKFIRALGHYYLLNFFGAVPLITSTDVKSNLALGRADTAAVYKQIIVDLIDAQSKLPVNYSTYSGRRDRPNQGAATALLARAYLAIGDNVNAEKQASLVIGNSLYSMSGSTNIDNVFLKASSETIWALNPETTSGHITTNEDNYYGYSSQYGALYGPQYVLLPALINSFEQNDLRLTHWINSFVYGGVTYYYGAKYKDYDPNQSPSEYSVVLRLSEQYLIRAEARAGQNNISGAQADLNVVRNRAGLSNTTASTGPALINAVLTERQHELFLEFATRWFDLRRLGRANSVLGALKPATWKTTAVWYPIPLPEIQSAPQLTQNPGY